MNVRQRLTQRKLLKWFSQKGRVLPWRKNRTAYRVVVAEFMLQQTQVDRVIPFYRRFLKRFPSLRSLARSRRSEVLRLWSGLGYNRRALYLHHLAGVVTDSYHGRFPRTEDQLRSLPGVGEYTARAILAFAYREPTYATDVNIARIVARASGSLDTPFQQWIGPITTPDTIHDAMMDLGATVCIARTPRCHECPLATMCSSAFAVPSASPRSKQKQPPKRSKIPMRLIRGIILRTVVASKVKISVDHLQEVVQEAFSPSEMKKWYAPRRTEVIDAVVALAREGFLTRKGNVVMAGSQSLSSLLQ